MAAPAPPAPTSAMAITALVLGILGWMCFGPIAGIAAMIVGALALWDIRASRGKKSGAILAWVGLSSGAATCLLFAAVIGFFFHTLHRTAPALPPTSFTPSPPSTSLPAPPPSSTATETREVRTVETHVGKITVVDIGEQESSLPSALRQQRLIAEREKQLLVLQTTSTECRPCQGVAAALSAPAMQTALASVRLVRTDVHIFSQELDELGVPSELIPGFFLLGTDLTARDGIHGGEWDDDVVDNIAPVLKEFVRGTLTRRRHPNIVSPTPKPKGTVL